MSKSLYMDLQPDWDHVRDESCWLNVYERTLHVSSGGGDASTAPPVVSIDANTNASFQLPLEVASTGSHGKDNSAHLVEITKREKQWIQVRVAGASAEDQDLARVVFQAPHQVIDLFAPTPTSFLDPAPTEPVTRRRTVRPQLFALDVSHDEKYLVAGGAEGKCHMWDLVNQRLAHSLEGHVLDVTRIKFFPSGKVVLTASLDFTLKIWSAASGRCAATLCGHRSGVTDVAVVGRGKNVASCATNGSVHLWSCASQSVVAAWNNEHGSGAQCLALLDDKNTVLTDPSEEVEVEAAENEHETEGKVLFTGLENGKTLGIDVRARDLVVSVQGTAPITACAASSHTGAAYLLTGAEDGLVSVWDLRQANSPLRIVSRSSSPVHRIAFLEDERASVWTAHGDGSTTNWINLLAQASDIVYPSTQLTGPEYDPVRDLCMAPASGRVFTACRDGLVRDYIPHFMS